MYWVFAHAAPPGAKTLPPVFVKSPLVFGGGFAFKAAYNFFAAFFQGNFRKPHPIFLPRRYWLFCRFRGLKPPGLKAKTSPGFKKLPLFFRCFRPENSPCAEAIGAEAKQAIHEEV